MNFSRRECMSQMDLIKDLVQLRLVSTLRICILRVHTYTLNVGLMNACGDSSVNLKCFVKNIENI